MQKLVARDEELSCELQIMESVGQQDERTSSIEQEQESNIAVTLETRAAETSQEVISENVESENDQASLNETDNQSELQSPRVADVGTANTVVTREPLMSSSNRTSMKFFVRNLEGHNDMICDVASSGSVLVSGRYVVFVHHLKCVQLCLHGRCSLIEGRNKVVRV